MSAFRLHRLMPVALCVAAFAAAGQTRKPDPLDANANVPPPVYVSAFGREQRMADDKAIAWREANETAARIGGWRAYAREARP